MEQFEYTFPDPRLAPKEGLIGWGGDLSPKRILTAYKKGIFPWYNENDPILWWSPDPRLILYPKDIKISKSLKKSIKKYEVCFNSDFSSVIRKCRDVRVKNKEGTWILQEIIEAYERLHDKGYIISVEVYFQKELVGGLYGVDLKKVFCGESMFSLKRDASKVALVALAKRLQDKKYDFIDCQIPTKHLKSMGAIEIERDKFLDKLELALSK